MCLAAAAALYGPSTGAASGTQTRSPGDAPVTTVKAAEDDLSGKWRFTTFGSIWTVDLKVEATADIERVYCGQAERAQQVAGTPIIKARLCAQVTRDDGQLRLSVQGTQCKAPFDDAKLMVGTCAAANMISIVSNDDDDPDMEPQIPQGRFTAIRVRSL